MIGADWSFENAIITEWYPGNPVEATQQNLGPRELPSNWTGDWRRTRLGRTPCLYRGDDGAEVQIVDPWGLKEAIELIARSGMRLRVTWNVNANEGIGSVGSGFNQVKNPTIVREGLVKKFAAQFTRHTDIAWQLEFHWASRGATQDRVVSTRKDEDLDAATNALSANALALAIAIDPIVRSAKSLVRKSATTLTLGVIEQFVLAPQNIIAGGINQLNKQIQSNIVKMKDLGKVVRKFQGQPAAIQASFINLAESTKSLAGAFVDAIGQRPPETLVNKSRPATILRGYRYFSNISDCSRATADSSHEVATRLRPPTMQRGAAPIISVRESSATRAGSIIAVHVCKQGDTPQRLSMRYYESADHGADILRANKLPLYQPTFNQGAVIIIPVLGNRASPL